MIDTIKAYWQLAVGLLLTLFIAYGVYAIHHHGYKQGLAEKQVEFDAYKAEVKKAADEQAAKSRATEQKQAAITTNLKAKYETTKTDRDLALARLRDYKLCEVEVVQGGANLRVAEGNGSAVPSETKSTTRPDDTASLAASFSFSNAVKDRDQCMAIQEWVRAQGME